MKKAVPLGTHVLVRPFDENERKTSGGIIIPDDHKGGDRKGVVEEKGSGDKWNDLSEIRKGDIVTFGRNSGIELLLPTESGEMVTFVIIDYKLLNCVE